MIVPQPLASAVSAHVGVVPRVEHCLASTSDGRFPSCVSWVAADERALGSPIGDAASASGFGRSAFEAASAAVGEALERYSASFVPHERLVHATANELGADAVRPERFALFAQWQYAQPGFPLQPFHDQLRVPWVRGRAIDSGVGAWLPAELVYLGAVPGAARIGYATSSGAACAATEEEAVVRGLFELLERDAFMIAWRCRLSLPLLEWRGHAKLRALDDRYFAPTGLHYAAVDLSAVHDVPSVLAVVTHPPGSPGPIGVGAGTSATVGVAWWKALSEAFAAHAAAARLAVLDPDPPAPDDVQGFDDHIRYFAFPERAAAAAFLHGSTDRVDVRDVRPLPRGVAGATRQLLDRIERAGSSAYAVDVTAPDVAGLGLHVVKTIAPELCPLDAPHRARFLGGSRLRRAAFDLGLVPRPLAVEELNPEPHPFP